MSSWSACLKAVRPVPDSLFALFFPAFCRVCHQRIEQFTRVPVCSDCLEAVRPYKGLECAQCGQFFESPAGLHETVLCGLCRRGVFVFEQARSFGWYEATLRALIHCLKYDRYKPLGKPLGKHLASAASRFTSDSFDLCVPVPLHARRQRRRGFNQSALLAAELSKIYGMPMAAQDCVRVRDTPPQTGLRASERRKNVAKAFDVPFPHRVKSKRVLLVDDVLTTGATANSCARALIDAGARGVCVLTLARVPYREGDVL